MDWSIKDGFQASDFWLLASEYKAQVYNAQAYQTPAYQTPAYQTQAYQTQAYQTTSKPDYKAQEHHPQDL